MLKLPGGAPSCCLGVGDGGGDLLGLVGLDLVGEVQPLFGDEVAEAVAGAGDRRRVVGQHPQAEGDHQDQVGELGEVKAAVSLRSGQGGLDAEPDDEDGGQATEDVESRGLQGVALRREQLGDGLSKLRDDVLSHQLLPLMLSEMECMESLTPLFTFCMVVGKFCWK